MMLDVYDHFIQMPFYTYFSQISAIPRSSGNEEAVSGYVVGFARDHRLEWQQDKHFNVIIRKKGSPGHEHDNPVVLQCHMDMVCEKTAESSHDFNKDPIVFTAVDGFLKADETSLGADNGVGMAYILTVLADENLIHPPIEAVFTTSEEVGLEGMAALDGNWVTGDRMINLDGEDEGILYSSCAGGARYYLEKAVSFQPMEEGLTGWKIAVNNLRGGHSGVDIDKGRGNSIVILARLITKLKERVSFGVSTIWGGSKTNAIPRDASAVIWAERDQEQELKSFIADFGAKLKQEYGRNEPDLIVETKPVTVAEGDTLQILSPDSLNCVLDCLLLLPNDLLGYSPDLPGQVECSSNLGIMNASDDKVVIAGLVRSNNNFRLDDVMLRVRRLADRLKFGFEERNRYPAWEFRKDSVLRDLSTRVFHDLFDREIETQSIHGGLECALMFEKKEEMDMISLGPNLYDVHTVNERADIASIIRVWEYLVKLLERLCS
ncbi:MAG: beta-Ala-His dipeptidase [Lachnospiraceae bacterium]